MKHYQTMLGKPDRSRSEQTCHSQGKAAGLEAMRSAAAEEKEAAVRRSAKAELDLQELQERIASVGSVQVRIISTETICALQSKGSEWTIRIATSSTQAELDRGSCSLSHPLAAPRYIYQTDVHPASHLRLVEGRTGT